MQIVEQTYFDIKMTMLEIRGDLYCSSEQLRALLGLDYKGFGKVVDECTEEFPPRVFSSLELLKEQTTFCETCSGILCFFGTSHMLLWPEDSVIGIIFTAEGEVARQLRQKFKEHLKKHATRTYVE